MYFLTPWSSINLVDFYLVRKESYDLEAVYDPDGRYGRWSAPALIAYVIGIAVQIPFSNVEGIFVGPLAPLLGGADISWLLGLLVPGALYLLMMRRQPH
ncbi:cytosine permease [Amycolatopsis sp. H20-H5]|uniref:cytosine permease n=1 Tax=Amycolatopsis sp. H20-H5 TaxID=3046309 RepID=UPI002DBD077E|nr:cytosine permease [Amycolatopsis sp. H20-H5]MEC3975611.1 cytosine permease [Amycolatopsis sp. H20-H5]